MKRFLPLLAALSLSACTLPTLSLGTQSPAPLAHTTVDDKALDVAWKSFDLALDGIAALRDAGAIKKGTPKAISVANGIDAVSGFLTAAESAAAAGSTTDYGIALANAKSAITQLRAALKGGN